MTKHSVRWVPEIADLLALRSVGYDPDAYIAVIHAVAEQAGLTPQDILGRDTRRAHSYPRQVAMALCLELEGASLPRVAAVFRRDHTTVLHARRAVARRMTPALEAAMQRVRERVKGATP